MLSPDNQDFELAGNTLAEGITIGRLIEFLDKHKEQPLIFEHGGRAIRSSYHVTEVKAGAFSALDCEANPESWAEIFVQLWDVEERDRSHMSAGKFAAIIRKVTEYVSLPVPRRPLTCHTSNSSTSSMGKNSEMSRGRPDSSRTGSPFSSTTDALWAPVQVALRMPLEKIQRPVRR